MVKGSSGLNFLKFAVSLFFILLFFSACQSTHSIEEPSSPGSLSSEGGGHTSSSISTSSSSANHFSSFDMVSSQIIISYKYSGADCEEEYSYQGGRGYQAGARVSYDNVNYVAIYWAADDVIPTENDAFEVESDCGYRPVYSTIMVSSLSESSSESTNPDQVAGWFNKSDYELIFPHRNSFYTWESFRSAFKNLQNMAGLGDFRNFLQEGTQIQKEREIAAFFANVIQETGGGRYDNGLIHIEENCANSGHPEGRCLGYKSSPPHYYFGRGPMQLSWSYNYESFSLAVYGDPKELLHEPDRVAQDPSLAWLSAMWFWNRVDDSYVTPPPTIHDVVVNNANWLGNTGFGATIKIINGGLECPSVNVPNAMRRVHFYSAVQSILGVAEDLSHLHCT